MKKPLISLLIPVFNTEKYLEKSLNSIIEQSYQNLEIIVVNDGSTDGSEDIINKFVKKDRRIKYFKQDNLGPAAARNLGLEKASGDYVAFVDSDDWVEKNYVEKLLVAAEDQVDLALCNFKIENPEKIPRASAFIPRVPFAGAASGQISDNYGNFTCNTVLWAKLFKKSLIDKYKIRFPTGLEHDDTAFTMQVLAVAQNYSYTPEKLYHYVIRRGSVIDQTCTRNHHGKQLDAMYVAEFVYEFLKKNDLLKIKANELILRGFAHASLRRVCEYRLEENDVLTAFRLYRQLKTKLENNL